MAIYYHEKQKFIYDSITKDYLCLQTFKEERAEYRPYPNNEDVGSYDFYEKTTTKICNYKVGLQVLLVWRNAVKITSQQKEEIISQWKCKVSQNEVFTNSLACDDGGNIRARELSL